MNYDIAKVILCADWGRDVSSRAVWLADVDRKEVKPLPGRTWTVRALLAKARTLEGRALVAIDAPIGVPLSYWQRATTLVPTVPAQFRQWVQQIVRRPGFFDPVTQPGAWRVDKPFFTVPAGPGALTAFSAAAAAAGVDLRRSVEHSTQGKSVFMQGLPGQVSLAAQALWCEIAAAAGEGERFCLWPFDDCDNSADPIIAEIYPRAAYGTALAPTLPAAPRVIAKTQRAARDGAIDDLSQAAWPGHLGVTIRDIDRARGDEDDFDACLTAAALLRLVLERQALATAGMVDRVAEGGMLCV